MTLRVFNVLQREKVEFVPLTPGKVNLYVCGPTVYDHAHLGHSKTYVSFDMVVRYLRYSGYDVLYVQNLTDVGHLLDSGEDRILKMIRERGSWKEMGLKGRERVEQGYSLTVNAPRILNVLKKVLDSQGRSG